MPAAASNPSPDVLVIGGGLIGLAIALELRQQGASVTVLSRSFEAAAGHAAAGMLAPHAEGLEPGPMLDLCRRSLDLYPDWSQKLEAIGGQTVGYWACGILGPRFTDPKPRSFSDSPSSWVPVSSLDAYQPGLSPDLQGSWWFPEDARVDNRALMQALRLAVQDLGGRLVDGATVTNLHRRQDQIQRVSTEAAGDFAAGQYVLATGAWSQTLLPVPVRPLKGQMIALQVPAHHPDPLPLKRVLFGENIYIVPRRDGRILIGATSEDAGFTPHNTPAGLHQLMAAAIALYPELQDFPVQECWWGFRPTTPDLLPILGPGPCQNLWLATGHHRNGVLLAPITAQLTAQAIQGQADAQLDSFSWERFHQSPAFSAPRSLPAQPAMPTEILPQSLPTLDDTPLVIAGRRFRSRLMTGTGKYDDFEVMRRSVEASQGEIVTVAVRRVQTNAPGHEGLAEALDWSKIWMLPNTAGCKTADEAIRVARLGREMAKLLGQEDNNFVKLEVIPDAKYLLPDPIGTLEAAEQLVKEGFAVLPYINADPLLAKRLEEAGCATVMPLGSPIGSGQGIRNAANIEIIIENAQVPVVVDAGIGTPSEAAAAMEMGADALLINTAIAQAKNPIAMGKAMGMATVAGRLAYLAGRIPVQVRASASSPTTGQINS
ncbi:glycine oxidase ThiO [filamentous cyanobacterium CCP5]|nr:glycine oxidase ThiO [filamentous cyanobacterium CCP5]